MSITINRAQAVRLLELFGGEDGHITLDDEDAPTLRAWFTDYSENGSVELPAACGVAPAAHQTKPQQAP